MVVDRKNQKAQRVFRKRGVGVRVSGSTKIEKEKKIKQLNQKEKKKIAKYIKNTIKI